jgi:hypothetical protein
MKVNNDYYTPYNAWKNISKLLPKNKIILEACMLNAKLSKSKENLEKLGFNVIGNCEWDFLNLPKNLNWDLIVSNIPFETDIKKKILVKMLEYDKPFIIIISYISIFSKYIRDIFKDKFKDLQVIIPDGKIHYYKLDTNKNSTTYNNKNTSIYSVYLAYKMNISNENLFL